MEGLRFLGTIPERGTREEFIILRDEPVYEVIKRYASTTDMLEIEGWARSFYTLEGHLESIMQYQKPLLPEPTDPVWAETKIEVMNDVEQGIGRVNSLCFETDLDQVRYESSSAAGYGYVGKKGEGINLKRAKRIANALVRTYEEMLRDQGFAAAKHKLVEDSTPDIAFTRTQLAKLPSIKVRNVYGEAFHYILIEGLSAVPLLEAFKREDTFYLIGKEPTGYVPRYLHSLDDMDGWNIALDWSQFDATVQEWEIIHAFHCLENVLQFPTRLSRMAFEVSKLSFIERKLAAPDGTLWMRRSGLPSGSYFTNIVGSIINYTRIRYLCNTFGWLITSCRVQGDDSVIKVESAYGPDILAMSEFSAQFGWKLNPGKCVVSDRSEHITFLGRRQYQLLNIRDRLKILRLMCFPEYKVDDPKISTARVRMIAADAGWRDSLFSQIYFHLKHVYGEADRVPPRLLTYIDKTVDSFGVSM